MENLWTIPKKLKQELDGFTGTIVTRFPPEPSGYLHIGHAKAVFINWVIAKKYNGRCLLRFDDTNPVKELDEYEKAIKRDFIALVGEPDQISYSSDYFQQILEFADLLVSKNLAYVDDSTVEEIKQGRLDHTNSKNRDLNPLVNQKLWDEMKNGVRKDSILRIKLDMKSKYSTMWDPTLYRYVGEPHHRTGNKYHIYPTYDFACPIVDSIEGVTHVFRSCEFADRDIQYETILSMLGLRKPNLDTYGKLNFQDSVLSKRKIKALIEAGKIRDWNDPRLLTLGGLYNKGLCHEGLIAFIARMGFSKNVVDMEEGLLWGINRQKIDVISSRFIMLSKECLENVYEVVDDVEDHKLYPRFHKNKDLGDKKVYCSKKIYIDPADTFEKDEEVTFMNWGNAIYLGDKKFKLNLDGDPRKTKKVLWLCCRDNVEFCDVEITKYGGVDDEIVTKYYLGEPDMTCLKIRDYVQVIKGPYCACEGYEDKKIYLVEVPY